MYAPAPTARVRTGAVYLHKATVMREGTVMPEGTWPDPWPPQDHPSDPLELLDLGYREVTAEFSARRPDEPSLTWYEPDQTVGFWIRGMAQETVVHRMDAELAAERSVTTAPDDLAADGGRYGRPPKSVVVSDGGDGSSRARVSAGPDAMLRWLWGRADDSVVTAAGDREWAAYLRRLLAATTGLPGSTPASQ